MMEALQQKGNLKKNETALTIEEQIWIQHLISSRPPTITKPAKRPVHKAWLLRLTKEELSG